MAFLVTQRLYGSEIVLRACCVYKLSCLNHFLLNGWVTMARLTADHSPLFSPLFPLTSSFCFLRIF